MARPRQEIPLEGIAAEIVQRPVCLGAVEGGLVHQMSDDLAGLRDLLPELGDGFVCHVVCSRLLPYESSAFRSGGKQDAFSRLSCRFMAIPAPWRSTSRY